MSGAGNEGCGEASATPEAVVDGQVRWSAGRKMTVVLELLRGAKLEATTRKYGVRTATLTSWREAFLEGGEAELKLRAVDVVDQERKRLKSAVISLAMDNKLLRKRIRQLEQEGPLQRWRAKP